MRVRKRKINESTIKKSARLKSKKAETEVFSLPTISEEKLSYDEEIITKSKKKGRITLPKVKVTCVPLKVEEIIDFGNYSVDVNEIMKIKNNSLNRFEKSSQKAEIKKSESKEKILDLNETFSLVKPAKNVSPVIKCRVKKIKKVNFETTSAPKYPNKTKNEAIKIDNEEVNAKSQVNSEKNLLFDCSFTSSEEAKINKHSFLERNYETSLKPTINSDIKTLDSQQQLINVPHELDEDSAYLEVNDINLGEVTSILEGSSDKIEKIQQNGTKIKIAHDAVNNPKSSNSLETAYIGYQDLSDLERRENPFDFKRKTLQMAVKKLMNSSEIKYHKEISALKKGLCLTWLSDNYACSNEQCIDSHCAVKLFLKKMKSYSTKFILNIVVSMRNDNLFLDVIMAAFKVLSERKIPTVLIKFLVYFVFCVTEPSDSRFLKFWANAARFFCQLGGENAGANGFSSLLSIFSKIEKSEEWKIFEFIKLIKQPPIQVTINFELLQHVLMLDIPHQFLTEVVESCIVTQKDVLKVYILVVPKIPLMSSPVRVIELLLKFCKTLRAMKLNSHAEDLKMRLQEKVKLFKTKITHHIYPLTAALQEEIILNLNENCLVATQKIVRPKENVSAENLNFKSNYLQFKSDFCDPTALRMDFVDATATETKKTQSLLNMPNNEILVDSVSERQLTRIQQFFRDCQFDLLGKYLNNLKPDIVELAAERFLKLLFQMKISLQQGVDLIRIILMPCKSENSIKVIASICITLIINLVRVNEWDKAYVIVSLCEERKINLTEGKVFYFNEFNSITQCRIALLLIEINTFKENYQSALKLIKKHFLFSSDKSQWKLTWKDYDETIRVKILEDFLQQVISRNLTEIVFDLFASIWNDQKQFDGLIDLRRFVDEILILLLNQNNKDALTFYEKIKNEVQLKDTTVRAVLVTLVRCSQTSAAKSILISTTQNVYSLPDIASGSVKITISSFLLEEEIYVMVDSFLDKLANKKRTSTSNKYENLEIIIEISKPNMMSSSTIRPLCLGIINPSFEDACYRIQRVLLYQFIPPLKLIIMPTYLKLDDYSLLIHLHKRVHGTSSNC